MPHHLDELINGDCFFKSELAFGHIHHVNVQRTNEMGSYSCAGLVLEQIKLFLYVDNVVDFMEWILLQIRKNCIG